MSDQALRAALTEAAPIPMPPGETVRYTPGDCALLIGPGAVLRKRLEALAVAGLRPVMLCTDDPAELPRDPRALAGRPARISGWMGAFRAELAGPQGALDLAPLSWHADGHFDWVLDFSGFPHPGVPSLGWYSLAPDDYPALKSALLEIAARLRGGHAKPRYFGFDAELCAHARQGVAGCQDCLPVCPAGALTGDKDGIRIEPHLCQGCGTCALVCPSGAVRHAVPGTAAQLTRLAAMLAAWRQTGGEAADLWIVASALEEDPPAGWLPFVVPEPASLGLEFWLAALTMGCGRVAIAGDGLPRESRQALEAQLHVGRALLAGLGYPAALGSAAQRGDLEAIPRMPALGAAALAPVEDKRGLLFAALDALIDPASPPASVPLPAGLQGEVRIAAEKCTLCAACARLCPTGALSLPGSLTQLAFTEEKCLQCGLCVNTCPERAVDLAPRLLTDKRARQAPRVLAEAEMFACAGCGKPFAPRALIARGQALMADHPMFRGENARLMTLCPDCRQKAMAGCPG